MRWRHTAVRCLLALSLLSALGQYAAIGQQKKIEKPVEPKFTDLIDPGSFPGKMWFFQSAKQGTAVKDVWQLNKADKNDPIIVCTGKPPGYLRTTKIYDNFELTLEWMYLKDACNSGILLNIAGKDQVWPAAIQMQLHRPTAGSIIKTRDPKSKLPHDVVIKNVNLPVGAWHKCKIISDNGTITVWLNGKQVSQVRDFEPKKGYIGLQSEDWEIHFRRIRIREIKPEAAATMVKSKKKPKPKPPEVERKKKSPTS